MAISQGKIFGVAKLVLGQIGSFPLDYDFGKNKPHYVVGMSDLDCGKKQHFCFFHLV